MFMLPTGGGKTVIAADIIRSAQEKGNNVIFCAPAISLIDQTVERFAESGITEVGVIQANHPLTDYSKPVQVASIQTLARRKKGFDAGTIKAPIVIIDEAHLKFTFLYKWMNFPGWEDAIFIGLSATPWSRGLGNYFDDLIVCSTIGEMIEQGYLSKFKVFAPSHPDLSSVKTVSGDFHEGQLSEVMQDKGLVGDVVDQWVKHAKGLRTIVFCVDRAHARKIRDNFMQIDVQCGYIDGETPREERKEIERQLHAGEIDVVTSVECLIAGIDWDIRCIVFARPTKSEILYCQAFGRGLRIAEGKEHLLVLDHADNVSRLGFPTDIHYDELCSAEKGQSKKTKKVKDVPLPKECPKCTFMKPPSQHACPNCGFAPEKQSHIESEEGELFELTSQKIKKKPKKKEYTTAEKESWYHQLLQIEREKGYRSGWAANQYREKFKVWPSNKFSKTYAAPTFEVKNWVRSRFIAYIKSKKKKQSYGVPA